MKGSLFQRVVFPVVPSRAAGAHGTFTDLQMRRQANFGAKRDEPFGGIILIPSNGIPIVRRELVMKVVIAFPERDEGGDQMVPRRMPIVERRLSEPMRERVEREDAMMHQAHAHRSRVDVPASPIAPEITRNRGRDGEAHEEDEGHVPPLLPAHDRALAEVAHVGHAGPTPRLDEHPADMTPPEAAVGVIWIKVGVDVAVVCAVAPSPPSDRTLGGAGTCQSKEYLKRQRRVVGTMRPKAVVTSRDAWREREVRRTQMSMVPSHDTNQGP
jgi:hypothetical protein